MASMKAWVVWVEDGFGVLIESLSLVEVIGSLTAVCACHVLSGLLYAWGSSIGRVSWVTSRSCIMSSPSCLSSVTDHCFADPLSKDHTSELQSPCNLVCRLLLEKKKRQNNTSGED